MNKVKWKWIKFWGYRYIMVSPDFFKTEYIIYHRKIYKVKDWENYFKNI